jgi:hypothetical protein
MVGIFRVFLRARAGIHDAEELEELLASRGFANRFFGRLFGSIRSTKTIADKITVPAILASILHPIVCVRLCDAPNPLRCRAVTQITALQAE